MVVIQRQVDYNMRSILTLVLFVLVLGYAWANQPIGVAVSVGAMIMFQDLNTEMDKEDDDYL